MADPLRRETEISGQRVLTGAEASTRQALAMRAKKRLRGAKPQKDLGGADTPLFDTHMRDQREMF